MGDDKKPQPTERTPKGLEVPIPKRREFFSNLKKVAEPEEKDSAPAPQPTKPRRV